MKTLAIETTGKSGSIALFDGAELIAQQTLNSQQRSAQSLAQALRDMLTELDWRPKNVDLIAVAQGPGSFTGLRVGVTAAKIFAYATDAQLIGVNTLEAIAAAVDNSAVSVWSIMDAQRNQIFAAKFSRDGDSLAVLEQTRILDIEHWLTKLSDGDLVTGPILEKLSQRLPPIVESADPMIWTPQAAWVGRVGRGKFDGGQRDDIWQFVPNYFRKSAAEEKRAEDSLSQP